MCMGRGGVLGRAVRVVEWRASRSARASENR